MLRCFSRVTSFCLVLFVCLIISLNFTNAQNSSQSRLIPGANVNMVSGTQWPDGDPYLQRQNEPSIAVSTRNPMHVLAGANDYRTVDIPGLPSGIETGDSWLGVFRSFDGGDSWRSTLLPGYPQELDSSSPLHGYRAAADPVMRAGTNGMFYFSGIAFDRGFNPKSTVFVARYIDLNNEEGGEPIKYLGTVKVSEETGGTYFIDKPWMAVDIPRPGAQTANISISGIQQNFDCGNVYVAWAEIVGDDIGMQSRIMFSRSINCGASFETPVRLSAANTLNQGATIAVAPDSGYVYVSWRQFPLPQASGCVPTAFQKFVTRGGQGYWKNHPEKWPTQNLTLGNISYTKTQLINILKTPVQGDATYTLAYQLIAAKLNYLVYPDASILQTINQADAWLLAHLLGSKPKDKQAGLDLSNTLQQYNEGPSPLACNPLDPANKIMATRSVNLGVGGSFEQPSPVSNIAAFDQGTSNISFRSTAYPTMTVDANGRAYLAWATRGLATTSANPDPVAGDSRIVVATCDGNSSRPSWTTPQPIDQPNVPGHQIKPALCFTAGKLFMLYYDFRQDVSGDFQQYVADLATLPKRHTVDVRAAVADPGLAPVFTDYISVLNPRPSDQMSRYPFLIVGTSTADAHSLQLQYNPPNLPLFVGGTAPFVGDYLDIVPAQAFVMDTSGNWAFNTAPSNGATLQATWTDNRDVKAPPDGDWTHYVPPLTSQSGQPSRIDSTQNVPVCNPNTSDKDRTGMRNQNVYNARVSRGLYVAAPANAKPLGGSQRTFVVFVQNTTGEQKSFHLQIEATPPVIASFTQSGPVQTSLDVTIAPYSSASATVFSPSQSSQGPIQVDVVEINPPSGQEALQGSVLLNPDPSNPPPADTSSEIHNPAIYNPAIYNPAIYNPAIYNPAIFNPAIFNPAIYNPAIYNPAIYNPAIYNPAIYNPAIYNPAIFNPAIFNPAIFNPTVLSPAIYNPAIYNPAIYNPAIFNQAIMNPAIYNTPLANAEVSWVIKNTGNTTSAYTFNALVPDQMQQGLIFQLLIYRVYTTPIADGCQLKQEGQQELISNTLNPNLSATLFSAGGKPTFFLSPGEEAVATLLAFPGPGGTPADRLASLQNFNPGAVSGGVVAEAVNSNTPSGGSPFPSAATMYPTSTPALVISTDPATVPGGIVGSPYNFALSAAGGLGTYGWSLAAGTLPPGLTLGSDGKISGTPTTPGTFTFTVRANDFVQTITRTFSIGVASGLVFFIQPRTATADHNMPLVQVLARDGSGTPISGVTITISLGTTPCTTCTLSGGTTAITGSNGIADFGTLQVNRGGRGYTLLASAGSGAITRTSNPFDSVGFCATGSMGTARYQAAAALLGNGKVLITGGLGTGDFLDSSELYDPSLGSWTPTGNLTFKRWWHTATRLNDGKVLVAGGQGGGGPMVAGAEIYDPSLGTWSGAGTLVTARGEHSATLLPSGNVLIAGGSQTGGAVLPSAEVYNASAGTWAATGSMATPRRDHTATLLNDGKVLVTGGEQAINAYLSSAEIYDPATATWKSAGSMAVARSHHTATMLPNGQVLVAGGWGNAGPMRSVEIFDPRTNSWTNGPDMSTEREYQSAILLPSGKVMVSGGYGLGVDPLPAELFSPTTNAWSTAGALVTGRRAHSAIELINGNVLVAGGDNLGTALSSAELFYPDKVHLEFTVQPGITTAGVAMPSVQVRAVDKDGNGISGIAVNMGIVSTSCPTCTLSGTTTIPATDMNGFATFSNLIVSRGGWGYRLFASASALGVMSASDQFNVAGFCETGSMSIARYVPSMTLLQSGKVLVAAGEDGSNVLNTAELYDPATGAWSSTGTLNVGRFSHAAVLLPDGRVLAEGGNGTMVAGIQASTEIYDPGLGTWSLTGYLKFDRTEHTATLLLSGKVLVAGGQGNGPVTRSSSEIYDPALGQWALTNGPLNTARYGHTATLLQDGRVLVAGGYNTASGLLSSAEIYDPVAGTWAYTGTLNAARHLHTATLLSDGRVLVTGGDLAPGWLSSAEIYNPATGTWSYAGPMNESRGRHTATLLPDGRVLVAGGDNSSGMLSGAELYDPNSNTFSRTGSMVNGRFLHRAVLLPNGKMLVAGGPPNVTELYYPACARYPSGYVPFVSVYYVSGPNSEGDRLLVGTMTMETFAAMSSLIPLPSFTNQCFCGLVELAPGRFATAYVPTAAERTGVFSSFDGLLIDPLPPGQPFPSGAIPVNRIPGVFAWRIRTITP